MPTFEIKTPVGTNQIELKKEVRRAVAEATRRGKLRPNSVDSITGANSGDNLGPGTPILHFEQWENDDEIEVRLILKGGGCENMNAQYLGANRAPASWPRRPHARRRPQVHPPRRLAGAGQGMRARRGWCGDRRRSHVGLSRSQTTAVPHAGRRERRSAPRRAGSGGDADGEHAGRRDDGVRRERVADRLQGRVAQSAARELLRVGRVRLLGVPSTRGDPRREDRHHQALALSRPVVTGHPDDRPGRLPAHRPRGRADDATRREHRALAESRRCRARVGDDVHRARRRARAPDEARAARRSARRGPLSLRPGRPEGRRRLDRHRGGTDDEHPRGTVSGRHHHALRRARS